MAYSIFISYRRKNSTWFAGRLYDSLKNRFNGLEIFMDVDEIEGGEIFKQKIDKAINDCIVFLPVIDAEWASIKDEKTDKKRLFTKDDLIVFEIERAILQRKIIIPVLMENSNMPLPKELPASIKTFVDAHAIRLKHESWNRDIDKLIKNLSLHIKIHKKYQAFISAPMTAFNDSGKFKSTKNTVDQIIKFLKQHCKWERIYFSGNNIPNVKKPDPGDIGAAKDLAALRDSEHFIMLYPERITSSCLVEAGYALALQIPSVYFYKNEADLPYVLKKASIAFSFIRSYSYKNRVDLGDTIEILANSIYKD